MSTFDVVQDCNESNKFFSLNATRRQRQLQSHRGKFWKSTNEESIPVLLVSEILQGRTRQRKFLQLAPIHI